MRLSLMLLFITPLFSHASDYNQFLDSYQLISGDKECAAQIKIEKRTDYKGKKFIGLNENGRGLICTFKNINQEALLEEGYCPTAGPTNKSCWKETSEESRFSNDTLRSMYTVSRYLNRALNFRSLSLCEVLFEGTTLIYNYKKSEWNSKKNVQLKKRNCQYASVSK